MNAKGADAECAFASAAACGGGGGARKCWYMSGAPAPPSRRSASEGIADVDVDAAYDAESDEANDDSEGSAPALDDGNDKLERSAPAAA